MKYFDSFTGIGGFTLAINKAYENLSKAERKQQGRDSRSRSNAKQSRLWKEQLSNYSKQSQKGDKGVRQSHDDPNSLLSVSVPVCVGFSEIDKYAEQIYQKHFPEHKNYGDITKIKAEQLPDFDLFMGGFPCQSFSIAGKRGGFKDTRGTLFFDIARILDAKRPRLLLLENVKGLLSHDGGGTIKTIISTLDELGYDLQWQVLNSKDFGVPQNRERIYIVGHLRGTPRPKVFPFTENDIEDLRLSGHLCNTLTARYEGAQANGTYVIESKLDAQGIIQLNNPVHSNDRIYSQEGISPTLNTMQGGNRQPFIAVTSAGRDGNNKSKTADSAGMRKTASLPRQLDGMSDTQRYKCCGNAVTTNVPQAILEKLLS